MDFDSMTCAELWAYVEDPANDPLDTASAYAVWEGKCWDGSGPTPQQHHPAPTPTPSPTPTPKPK